ncbi:hypothetical protein E2562_031834 [Oryza meyeriana var. granulata]|uniref:Uncharacterized protein n=1 Tax=Oryza meyeriana var. granulata TaxID=110450 RepID=A0A6G1CVF6_9ORYZ|nr:hypothetical protein E2562_031833 [Oryza meyeriana var. granulata]KAF0904111.1 hypothetical protein E2562_031834 [Oryza meyeriana var. granulata]
MFELEAWQSDPNPASAEWLTAPPPPTFLWPLHPAILRLRHRWPFQAAIFQLMPRPSILRMLWPQSLRQPIQYRRLIRVRRSVRDLTTNFIIV